MFGGLDDHRRVDLSGKGQNKKSKSELMEQTQKQRLVHCYRKHSYPMRVLLQRRASIAKAEECCSVKNTGLISVYYLCSINPT